MSKLTATASTLPILTGTPAAPIRRIDVADIKRAAAGHWPELLSALGGIPADVLDGNHHPCPKCAGTDRFRMIDVEAGALYCNSCFSKGNGDGIAALQHFAGVDFSTALRMLADHLGLHNANGKPHTTNGSAKRQPKKEPTDEATLTKGIEDVSPGLHAALLEMYCKAKPPITPEGIRKCGGIPVRWNGYRCLRIDGYQTTEDASPTAIVLLPIDGKPFPAFGKIGERKSHTVKGSVNSWISSGDVVTAETILDVEGISDLLAAVSAGLPLGCVAVTNTAGAKARGKLPRPWAEGKKIIVAGDADEPGADGTKRSAAAYHKAGAGQVLLARLPYEIAPNHGKDLRDWLLEGHQVADLPTVAVEKRAENNADANTISSESFPLTDTGNGERFALQHGDDVRYCYAWAKWLAWDGTRWKIDDSGAVEQLVKQTVRNILREAADEPDDDRREAIVKFAHSSESVSRRAAMLTAAKSEPPIPIRPDVLDKNAWILNCTNGKLDLHTGRLCEHRREDYITKLCPVEWHSDALCPTWLATLDKCFGHTRDLIDYVQRFAGYCLTGDVSEQILNIWHGIGANGKSTILNALMEMLGPDYAMKATTDLLLTKHDGDHPTALTDLHGKRLVACIETDDGRRLAEALVKELTGGDPIRARRMREDFWQFNPTHKVVLACNHKPVVRGTDHAIWRRLKLVPFNVVIPTAERDKQLPAKLRDELPGILAWSVRGCLDWQAHGLGEPKAIIEATADYQTGEDVLLNFVSECCVTGTEAKVKATDLLNAYKEWSGDRHITTRRLTAMLSERGIERYTSNGLWYRGVGIVANGMTE